MKKTLILVTGPIGVGKSTFAEIMLQEFPFKEMEYINADLYFSIYFRGRGGTDAENYANAKKYCWYKLKKAASLGNSFIWETVVAKDDKIDFLKNCRSSGYNILCLFIGVDDLSLLAERVTKRHQQGWYDIPQSKLESRYTMVMDNMKTLIELSDEFIAIDASNGYEPMFSILGKELSLYQKYCSWLKNKN